jgi:ornithine decarboxylase
MLSENRVEGQLKRWTQDLPAVRPYYAVKCNPEPKLIHMMRENAAGFDCASSRELSMMKTRGHFRDSIIYANPCKSERDIEFAKETGSPVTVVDSIEEVHKLSDMRYEGGTLIRIKVDDSGSKMPFGTKFGCTNEDVLEIGKEAKQKNISVKGISFHVGSGSYDVSAHYVAIQNAVEHCKSLLKLGHYATMIDIGGGFITEKQNFTLRTANIRHAINNANKVPGLRFIAEPGRFFATDSHDLFVQVIGKKPAHAPSKGWRYTLDESLYGQFTNILFDHQKPRWIRIPRAEETRQRSWGSGILFGRTCDSLDVIARSDAMEELEVGDWLWFPSMGAYTTATASEFNGFPKPPTFIDFENHLPSLPSIDMNTSVKEIRYVKHVSNTDLFRDVNEKIDTPFQLK